MAKAKKIGIIFGIIIAGIGLAAISPYFYNTSIDEAAPGSDSMDVSEMTKQSGVFVGVGDGIHDAAGDAMVLSTDDGTRYLRFENFKATNGPDLYVYLSTDEGASDYVSLGTLKANMGNQNYEIPSDVNVAKYSKVLIWCKAFSVLFGSADLA